MAGTHYPWSPAVLTLTLTLTVTVCKAATSPVDKLISVFVYALLIPLDYSRIYLYRDRLFFHWRTKMRVRPHSVRLNGMQGHTTLVRLTFANRTNRDNKTISAIILYRPVWLISLIDSQKKNGLNIILLYCRL